MVFCFKLAIVVHFFRFLPFPFLFIYLLVYSYEHAVLFIENFPINQLKSSNFTDANYLYYTSKFSS